MLQQRTETSVEQLALHIRSACERVDTLSQLGTVSHQQRERLSQAFEDLFLLLEQLRLAEKELRLKNDELLSFRDIMEIERERYQELFESAPDAYLLTGADLTIQESNNAAAEMFQMSRENLKYLTLMLFIAESDHRRLREQISRLRKQESIRGLELPVQPREGPVIPVHLTIGAIYDSQNILSGIHWFLRDVSKQKETENALRMNEERFRSIAESSRDAIIVTDHAGNILSWNKGAEDMFFYAETEIVGEPLATLVPARYSEAHQNSFELLRSEAESNSTTHGKIVEIFGVKKDRSEFPVEISASTWKANDNTYFTVIFRDITERKQAEEMRVRLLERVLAAQEEDRRWIARELHDETGQSLSSLLVGLRMIEEARSLKKAKVEANRLRMIAVQTLDDVGRLAKGLRPIVLDDLGLVVALKRHASDFARSFNITIDFKTRGLDSERLPLAAETALFRIAQEALTNIAKHSGAKNVQFLLKQDESNIDLSIQDDGRGFDVEIAFQAGGVSNHLGIHGMRERAALLGGSVVIESKPNEGTSVYVRISKSAVYNTTSGLES